MKVSYTTRDGRLTFEIEGATQTDIWEQLASIQEVFEDTTCTKYGQQDDNTRFVVRENDDNKYYELRYNGNNTKLFGVRKAFGQHKKGGGLFPRRKDESGSYLPDNGWVKWNPDTKKEE